MKILKRVASWLEAWARIWAEYWLLIIGSGLVCASVLLRWINFPLSRDLTGLQVPFVRAFGLAPHYRLLSYGVLAIAILAVGLLSRSFSRRPLLAAAVILFTVVLTLPCQLAFEEPAVLHRLSDETSDVTFTRSFTRKYLPQNYGYVEDMPRGLEFGTAWGRLVAAASFLGLGWASCGAGSVLVALYAFSRFPRGTPYITMACLCLPLGALFILLTRPLIGQHYFISARVAQAQGDNEKAISFYRRAMWWDCWFDEDITTYAMIGDLQRQSNVAEGSPERHINQALAFKDADQYEAAIFEFHQAATSGGSVAVTARREAARTRLEFGLALYRAGAIGAAVSNWQQALAENPAQLEGFVFLASGNYDIGRYQAALNAANQVIKAAGLNSVLANAYSLGGDCYTKLGQNAAARHYYSNSISLDNDINLWAAAGLAGN